MKRGLQIVLAMLSLIPAYYGIRNTLLGAAIFIDPETVNAGIDSQFRFQSGVYFGLALIAWWIIPKIERHPMPLRLLTIALFFGGFGRVLSYLQYGPAGPIATGAMVLELLLPLLILWQNAVIRRAGA